MRKGYIYRHWIINDKGVEKSYIGQTRQNNVELRWGNNGSGYKPLNDKNYTKFWNAICKYGWDSFNHDVLDIVENESVEELVKELNKLEKQYIKKYDSYYNGYNSTVGGEGVITSSALSTAKTIINVIDGNINNDKQKLKNVYNKIKLFDDKDKQYFIELMVDYFSNNKDVLAYSKRLKTKFDIQLNIEQFVEVLFFKQFSFTIFDTFNSYAIHYGKGNHERAFAYELLFTDCEWGREATVTCGQLCRLHSTIFQNKIYSRNTFSSKRITTVWHDDIERKEEKEAEKEEQNNKEAVEEILQKWNGEGNIPNYTIKDIRHGDITKFFVAYVFNGKATFDFMDDEEYKTLINGIN